MLKKLNQTFLAAAAAFLIVGSVSFADIGINHAEDAIMNATTLKTINERSSYLVHEAKNFMENEQYLETRRIAEYILNNLDETSDQARELLETANRRIHESRKGEVNPVEFKF